MKRLHRADLRLAATVAALLAPAAVAAAPDAEFALRWKPAQGGPKTATEVHAVLNLDEAKGQEFVIQYFRVRQPAALSTADKAIARQRQTGDEPEAMYKLRGPNPIGSTHKHCPLAHPDEEKDEVDVSWTGENDVRRSHSYSCTARSTIAAALPPSFEAAPLGCISRMTRFKAGGIKIERWELAHGEIVFEVSLNGKDKPADLKTFRTRVVAPLMKQKIKPLTESKTELGSAC